MDEQCFSSAGFVLKTEKIRTIDSGIVPDTLVAEALEPFPGYHGENIPESLQPEYIFLFLKYPYTMEDIVRAAGRLQKYCRAPFESHYTRFKLFNNEYYYAIRLRRMEDYSHIKSIQECFMDEGLQFMKARKIEATGLLKVFKFLQLESVAEGVYKDANEQCIHYLEMPGYMNWKLFVDITHQVKNNVEVLNFDAAQTSLFDYQNVREFVRIYCFRDERQQEKLHQLRTRYLQFFESYKKIL